MRRITEGLLARRRRARRADLTDAAHAQKKTLVVALFQDPDILDPTLARPTWAGSSSPTSARSSRDRRESPDLAAAGRGAPAITDGGRTVTIKLRSGVKFNDGTPMDAESVKFSLDRHRTLKGSNRASELAPVEGSRWSIRAPCVCA